MLHAAKVGGVETRNGHSHKMWTLHIQLRERERKTFDHQGSADSSQKNTIVDRMVFISCREMLNILAVFVHVGRFIQDRSFVKQC